MIQNRVVEELNREFELASQPGYSSRYDDDYLDDLVDVPPKPHRRSSPENQGNHSPEKDPPAGKAKRVDSGSNNHPTPHKPNQDAPSESSKSSNEEFGNGIFD
jgi:hypothetical protein